MINPEEITICTTCMNRNQFLNRALLTWLGGGFHEIIITDWSSEKPVSESLDEIRSKIMNYREGVRVVEVPGQTTFNCTGSRNMAARFCRTPFIWFVDSDVMINLKRLRLFQPTWNSFFHGTLFRTGAPTTGTCLVHRLYFKQIGGYSERITTLPGEDLDLYKRLKGVGLHRKHFPFGSLKHIPHPYYLRTKYRPWFGMSRARGTREAFKTKTWTGKDKQAFYKHRILEYKKPGIIF